MNIYGIVKVNRVTQYYKHHIKKKELQSRWCRRMSAVVICPGTRVTQACLSTACCQTPPLIPPSTLHHVLTSVYLKRLCKEGNLRDGFYVLTSGVVSVPSSEALRVGVQPRHSQEGGAGGKASPCAHAGHELTEQR
jgi:hypothetical protein